MIKTEMVTMKRPETISSYEELLAKPQTRPLWTKAGTDHWEFMRAAHDSPAGRVWDRANRMGIDDSIISLERLSQEKQNISEMKAVMLTTSSLVGAIITNFCAESRRDNEFMDVNVWVRSDESAPEMFAGSVYSASMHHDKVTRYSKMNQAVLEHSLLDVPNRSMEFILCPDPGTKSVRDCVANDIVYPDLEFTSPPASHYSRLFLVSGYSMIVCCLILFLEITLNRKQEQ